MLGCILVVCLTFCFCFLFLFLLQPGICMTILFKEEKNKKEIVFALYADYHIIL